MAENAYALRKRKDTDEIHLFEGLFTPRKESLCTVGPKSICEKATFDGTTSIPGYGCKTEDEIRILAAQKGRTVCGTCVSHLYNTYPD